MWLTFKSPSREVCTDPPQYGSDGRRPITSSLPSPQRRDHRLQSLISTRTGRPPTALAERTQTVQRWPVHTVCSAAHCPLPCPAPALSAPCDVTRCSTLRASCSSFDTDRDGPRPCALLQAFCSVQEVRSVEESEEQRPTLPPALESACTLAPTRGGC